MSMSIGTPTLITISIETKPSRKCRRGDRSTKRVRANGSIVPKIAREFPIATRAQRKNSIGQVHPTQLSRVMIFVGAPMLAGRIWRAAARVIAQEQVTAAAPANLAVATGREQRIVVGRASSAAERIAAEQANSAVVVEQIEAVLEAAAAPFKGSEVGEARQRARVSAVVRVGRAVVVEDLAVAVEDLAAAVEVAAAAAAGSDVLANRVRDRCSCSQFWTNTGHEHAHE
jgi:hypothetical protein